MGEFAPARRARNEPQTQRDTTDGRATASPELGHPLHEDAVRVGKNPRAGHDFSQIQVHSREDFPGPAGASKRAPRYLAVSSPADPHEHAADRAADEVTAQIGHAASAQASQVGSARPSRQPTVETPASVVRVLAEPGRPLDGAVRHDMERRFDHDFSGVRIHEGRLAEQSTREMKAQAFAVGQDVVFRAGRYAPGTREGQTLIAHELAHTVDQAASATRRLDHQGKGHAGPAVLDMPTFPYDAGVAVDEVALRSSPAGRRADDRFHNLLASLRRDVRLVVEGHTGRWMKVRVTSGTALSGKTNRPMDAAGLTGYVSAELLVRQATPAPATRWPPIDPAAYSSLEGFSAAWPDRVSSTEAIEKVWLSQSKQAWTSKALAAAGIKPGEWRPAAGFRKSKQVFEKVYHYYTSLYLADNRLKWAAMAKLAGGEVFRGFRDQIVPAEEFGEFLSSGSRRDDITVTDVIGTAYQVYAGSLGITLLQMQEAIFMDLAWQHQAYREGGIKALAAARARGELSDDLFLAWQNIDSGEPNRVNAGNMALLKREQYYVLQGGNSGKGFYGKIQDIPDNDMIPETMSEEARSPIPGGKPFAEVVPGGDITKFDDRWRWLEKDMIPAFEKLKPDTLQPLVKKSLGELADRKF